MCKNKIKKRCNFIISGFIVLCLKITKIPRSVVFERGMFYQIQNANVCIISCCV